MGMGMGVMSPEWLQRVPVPPLLSPKRPRWRKTSFDVKLEEFDAGSKIKIVKEVRNFVDLGLKEAKELVEKAPVVLKSGVGKNKVEKIIERLKSLGATAMME